MTRAWITPLFLGLFVGILMGFGFAKEFRNRETPKGSAFFRDFSIESAAGEATHADWKVIEDRIYDRFPDLGHPARIARRVAAHATTSPTDQRDFVHRVQHAVATALASHGAVVKGQFEAHSDSTDVVNGTPVNYLLDLPRFYYAIGETRGVADVWCIAQDGRVTAIVSLIEGL